VQAVLGAIPTVNHVVKIFLALTFWRF